MSRRRPARDRGQRLGLAPRNKDGPVRARKDRCFDLDGADNVLGGPGIAEGGGEDDNFSPQAGSSAIDAGSAFVAPFDSW